LNVQQASLVQSYHSKRTQKCFRQVGYASENTSHYGNIFHVYAPTEVFGSNFLLHSKICIHRARYRYKTTAYWCKPDSCALPRRW
jgi:hypothetical protein